MATKQLATKAAGTAAGAASQMAPALRPNFNVGNTKVFLPNHVITMLRPSPKKSPNLATFKVPLSFNKFDFRDYLFHAYGVNVTAVRSYVQQSPPARKGTMRGRWYRPMSHKYMIVELERPFVWPDPPAEEAREDFDYEMWKQFDEEREQNTKQQKQQQRAEIPLRSSQPKSEAAIEISTLAREFQSGKLKWTNNSSLDEIWSKYKMQQAEGSKSSATTEDQYDDSIIFEKDDDISKKT